MPSNSATVASWLGSEPAPPGSVIANTDRCRPSITGSRNWSICSVLATLPSRNMLPSSGAAQLSAIGPSVDQPAASNNTACSRCDGSRPPNRLGAWKVSNPASRASSTSSARSPSSGPCRVSRASVSKGTILSLTKARISSRCAASSAGMSKSIMRCPSVSGPARTSPPWRGGVVRRLPWAPCRHRPWPSCPPARCRA